MIKKSSAHYQREFRKRLREQGLVKKEVWIHPDHAKQLHAFEKQLRTQSGPIGTDGVKTMNDKTKTWNTIDLHQALQGAELFTAGSATLELIEGVDPSIHIVMREFGDLPIFITVVGEQIVAESVLWSVSEVKDVAAFNDTVLRTHKYFPLSTVSLDNVGGANYYHMFGALSASSILENIILEIETLAANVIHATEAYSEFLTIPVES